MKARSILVLFVVSAVLFTATMAFADYAYVPNAISNDVSVIDTTTNSVITSIPVGDAPEGVCVSPDGVRVYVANRNSGDVSVIDTGTNTVIDTIPIGLYPMGLAVSTDNNYLYVGSRSYLYIVDTATDTVVDSVYIGLYIYGMATTPDGQSVYIAQWGVGKFFVFDTTLNQIVDQVRFVPFGQPYGVAASPDNTRVYVTIDDTMGVIDTSDNSILARIVIGGLLGELAVTPDGSKVYVTNRSTNNVYVIDTATNTVAATIPVGATTIGVSITSDGTLAYVTNFLADTVTVIDTATDTAVNTIPVGDSPVGLGLFITPGAGTAVPGTIEEAITAVENLLANGQIDNAGVANSLTATLESALQAQENGNVYAARNTLLAFINKLQAQTDKHISEDAAQLLIDGAIQILDSFE